MLHGSTNWNTWAAAAVNTLTMEPGANNAAWVALFAPSGTYQDPMTAPTTDVAAVYALTRTTFPDWMMLVSSAVGDLDGGAIEWISQGHLPHGPAVTLHGCSVIRLNGDALVVRWRDYFDMGEFTRQAQPGDG
jgi:hypothetical protein